MPGLYNLDLNDIFDFPDNDHIPILPPKAAEDETWTMLLEIVRDESILRPVFATRDKTGARLVVALYTDDPVKDALDLRLKIGHTLCIKDATFHVFADGQCGFRIEDASKLETLPVSLDKLLSINTDLRTRSDRGELKKCKVCGGRGKMGCSVCKTRYCAQECQKNDWPRHKGECVATKALHKWNKTKWN